MVLKKDAAAGDRRDGSARAGLQSDTRLEHHGRPAAPGGDEGLALPAARTTVVTRVRMGEGVHRACCTPCASISPERALVSRFRSSPQLAASSDANFEIEKDTGTRTPVGPKAWPI